MLRRFSKTATAVMLGLTASNGVQAVLFNVAPGPYTPANAGFAAW